MSEDTTMTDKQLSISDVESIYDHLAGALDQVAPDKREIFLVKLALLSAHELREVEPFFALTQTALLDL
jgi:hypothetical protein